MPTEALLSPGLLPRFMSSRRASLVVLVVALHVGLLYALQAGLMQRVVEIVVPAEVVDASLASDTPAQPRTPPPPTPPTPPAPKRAEVAPVTPSPMAAPVPTPETAPAPVAHADAAPTPVSSPPAPAAPVAAPAPAAISVPTRIDLPSTDAAYLHNPKPPYPSLSKRLGEQGKVVVHVLIGVDGTAQQAEVRTSSGFVRLDQAALNTVRQWRYVPGKRNGVPEAMWFNVPINFVLD